MLGDDQFIMRQNDICLICIRWQTLRPEHSEAKDLPRRRTISFQLVRMKLLSFLPRRRTVRESDWSGGYAQPDDLHKLLSIFWENLRQDMRKSSGRMS